MDNVKSPYLHAIQSIEGSTPGEKYKTINKAAKAAIDAKKKNDRVDLDSEIKSTSSIPDLLIPMVRAEVSKNMKEPEGIIEALKSDDNSIFERALRAKWFFDGSDTTITNYEFFQKHIIAHISLNNRIKLVKYLAINLLPNKSSIAEEFYVALVIKYGEKLAEPLLMACSEAFLRKLLIEDRKIILSLKLTKLIYQRHPDVIIDYLKLSKPSDNPRERNLKMISIYDYRSFLPQLLSKHTQSFIEIIEMHKSSLNVQLSRKKMELFMKNGLDATIQKPCLFLPMLNLKLVTMKLTKTQFELMFKNLFPPRMEEFSFDEIFKYLEYHPKDKKVSLLLSTFEEVYGTNLLDHEEKVPYTLLKVLPADDRVRLARIRLEKDNDWHLNARNIESSWRCYLPIEESIPLFKNQINKSSDANDRRSLVMQMLYTCSVNGDTSALLQTLKHIISRHKNEQGWILLEILDKLVKYFKPEKLLIEHWQVIDDIIQLLRVKNELNSRIRATLDVITGGIYFSLINNLPISNRVDVYIEVSVPSWNRNWNILRDNSEYERKCLDAFLTGIPKNYSEENEIWKDNKTDVVISLLEAIQAFNEKNSKQLRSTLENFKLKNYSWLMEAIKDILHADDKTMDWTKQRVASELKNVDRELYDLWVPKDDDGGDKVNITSIKTLVLLRKEPEKVKADWERYLKSCRDSINYPCVQRFLKLSRWHQELPINFCEKSLSNLANKKDDRSLMVLGVLYEGASFENLVTPLIPKTSDTKVEGDNAKQEYAIHSAIIQSLTITEPPVSLDLVLSFCVGDYMHTAVNCLTNVGRRVSVDKVIPFAMKLMDKGVSIKKHGVRLFNLVASIDEIREMSSNWMKTEKHRSIRAIVFDKVLQLFIDDPSNQTWLMVQEAIKDLKPDDDVLESMTNINKIPNEFIADYVKMLLGAIRKLKKLEVEPLEKAKALSFFNTIILSATEASWLFPESLHEFILQEYFANLSEPDYALSGSLMNYLVYGFLCQAEDKLENRLQYLSNILSDMMKNHWDVRYGGRLLCNTMISTLRQKVITDYFLPQHGDSLEHGPIMKTIAQALFKVFFSFLKPQQEQASYLYLTYILSFEKDDSPEQVALKIREVLPGIIKTFAPEFLSVIASSLYDFLNRLFKNDENENKMWDVVENLLKFEDDSFSVLASMLLYSSSKITSERFWSIVKRLQKHKHPVVVSYAYMSVNSFQ